MTIIEELRTKKSRDNRELLDRAADEIERLRDSLRLAVAIATVPKGDGGIKKYGGYVEVTDVLDLPSALTNEEKVSEKEKQIEGEWVVDVWDGEEWVIVPYIKNQHTDPFCSVCYECALYDYEGKEITSAFCPHCGAKMKGGAE